MTTRSISIHALREEGDLIILPHKRIRLISIHALREEGDLTAAMLVCTPANFYPRPPRGGRRLVYDPELKTTQFLSTPSARRATQFFGIGRGLFWNFYPRPPRGGRQARCARFRPANDFYPRPPRGGRPFWRQKTPGVPFISIHALREEGDLLIRWRTPTWAYFYPRPPRGGRPLPLHRREPVAGFLSTPSARRATAASAAPFGGLMISIHALREEGDLGKALHHGGCNISIHALREEGDNVTTLNYPRIIISIHALREEGDLTESGGTVGTVAQFLSTPSARRATAKTETKSLFSNKLYNILHEFRRALIYNGSKSYPNHAK